jgi:hypothetical protein
MFKRERERERERCLYDALKIVETKAIMLIVIIAMSFIE